MKNGVETIKSEPIIINLPVNLIARIEQEREKAKQEKDRIDGITANYISLLLSGFLTGQNGAGDKRYNLSADGKQLIEIIEQ